MHVPGSCMFPCRVWPYSAFAIYNMPHGLLVSGDYLCARFRSMLLMTALFWGGQDNDSHTRERSHLPRWESSRASQCGLIQVFDFDVVVTAREAWLDDDHCPFIAWLNMWPVPPAISGQLYTPRRATICRQGFRHGPESNPTKCIDSPRMFNPNFSSLTLLKIGCVCCLSYLRGIVTGNMETEADGTKTNIRIVAPTALWSNWGAPWKQLCWIQWCFHQDKWYKIIILLLWW